MRLLGQLFLQPDVEYTVGELESATSIPQQTISRELARLVQAGLVRAAGKAACTSSLPTRRASTSRSWPVSS